MGVPGSTVAGRLAVRAAHLQVPTTFNGDLYEFNAATGAILLKQPLSAMTSAAVTIDGDYVIAGAGGPLSTTQQPLIIAHKLGARGKLPDAVGS